MSEKGQSRKTMFRALKNFEELRRLYHTDTPVLAYAFKRQTDEGWTPEHSHQLLWLHERQPDWLVSSQVAPRFHHPGHASDSARRSSELVKFRHKLIDLSWGG
jgi:hypothetical protein